jgi:hypothetical protein
MNWVLDGVGLDEVGLDELGLDEVGGTHKIPFFHVNFSNITLKVNFFKIPVKRGGAVGRGRGGARGARK